MSDDRCAVEGHLIGYKTMADGALRLTVELTEFQAQSFHQSFPAIHCRVAVVAIQDVPPESGQ